MQIRARRTAYVISVEVSPSKSAIVVERIYSSLATLDDWDLEPLYHLHRQHANYNSQSKIFAGGDRGDKTTSSDRLNQVNKE